MPNRYNLPNIRALLTEGFTEEQLRRLCYDSPEFRPVYDQLAEETGKTEIRQYRKSRTEVNLDKKGSHSNLL